jgi:hypothetical protein
LFKIASVKTIFDIFRSKNLYCILVLAILFGFMPLCIRPSLNIWFGLNYVSVRFISLNALEVHDPSADQLRFSEVLDQLHQIWIYVYLH